MNPWLVILVLLAILAVMWKSDRILNFLGNLFHRHRPYRDQDDKLNNIGLFGEVDLSKTRPLFKDEAEHKLP